MKVFSKQKFINDMGEDNYNNVGTKRWVDECDGLSIEEMKELRLCGNGGLVRRFSK